MRTGAHKTSEAKSTEPIARHKKPIGGQNSARPGLNSLWNGMATNTNSVQAKLQVGGTGDQYEQEADAVADKVMRMPASSLDASEEQHLSPNAGTVGIQRLCTGCAEEGAPGIQKKGV